MSTSQVLALSAAILSGTSTAVGALLIKKGRDLEDRAFERYRDHGFWMDRGQAQKIRNEFVALINKRNRDLRVGWSLVGVGAAAALFAALEVVIGLPRDASVGITASPDDSRALVTLTGGF